MQVNWGSRLPTGPESPAANRTSRLDSVLLRNLVATRPAAQPRRTPSVTTAGGVCLVTVSRIVDRPRSSLAGRGWCAPPVSPVDVRPFGVLGPNMITPIPCGERAADRRRRRPHYAGGEAPSAGFHVATRDRSRIGWVLRAQRSGPRRSCPDEREVEAASGIPGVQLTAACCSTSRLMLARVSTRSCCTWELPSSTRVVCTRTRTSAPLPASVTSSEPW